MIGSAPHQVSLPCQTDFRIDAYLENPVFAFQSVMTKVTVIKMSAIAAEPSQIATKALGIFPANCAKEVKWTQLYHT